MAATEEIQSVEDELRSALEGESSPADQEAEAAMNAIPDNEASIEELAEEPKPTPPMQIPIPGTFETISLAAGGAAPTSSEARLLGGSMPVEGQYAKGDTVVFLVEAKVTAVEFIDKTDDWGTVERTVRRHKMRMVSVRKAQ